MDAAERPAPVISIDDRRQSWESINETINETINRDSRRRCRVVSYIQTGSSVVERMCLRVDPSFSADAAAGGLNQGLTAGAAIVTAKGAIGMGAQRWRFPHLGVVHAGFATPGSCGTGRPTIVQSEGRERDGVASNLVVTSCGQECRAHFASRGLSRFRVEIVGSHVVANPMQ